MGSLPPWCNQRATPPARSRSAEAEQLRAISRRAWAKTAGRRSRHRRTGACGRILAGASAWRAGQRRSLSLNGHREEHSPEPDRLMVVNTVDLSTGTDTSDNPSGQPPFGNAPARPSRCTHTVRAPERRGHTCSGRPPGTVHPLPSRAPSGTRNSSPASPLRPHLQLVPRPRGDLPTDLMASTASSGLLGEGMAVPARNECVTARRMPRIGTRPRPCSAACPPAVSLMAPPAPESWPGRRGCGPRASISKFGPSIGVRAQVGTIRIWFRK